MSPPLRDLRRLGVVLFLGIAAGAGVRYYLESRARTHNTTATNQPLIDWNQVRKVALKMSKWEQAPLHNRAFRQEQYTRMVKWSEPLIADYLGVNLPQPIQQVYVLDRREWLEANFTSFELLFQPIEEIYQDKVANRGVISSLFGGLNRQFLSAQMGMLLGFLGQRVLGQYDLSLLSPDPNVRGVLYYVEPNIANVQAGLGLNDEEFRLWIALHETTHVFEFEAYPWVRPHFNALLRDYFDQLNSQIDGLGEGLWRIISRLGQNISSDRHWIELVLTPEQRRIFEQLQALMSLAEGYSNHIMNTIGEQMLPSFRVIEKRMEERRRSRSLFEHLFYRLTGLDLKMAQYQQGEAFVNSVVEQRGIEFASRAWQSPDHLPTIQEIQAPEQWIARVERMA